MNAFPVSSIETLLRNAIEECEKLVKLLLLDGIVFVIVAAGAAHGHAHPDAAGGFDTVHDVLGLILLRNRAAFEVDHVVTIEARRDLLLARRIGKEIARQLLDCELVVGRLRLRRR